MRPFLWLRHALRNLRSGLHGFWIFLACLALGVGAMAIIGALGAAVERGIAEQGQPLLGGDIEFTLIQRDVTVAEGSYVGALGAVSRIATLRGMANAKGRATLVEIKAVDAAYPLFGTLELAPSGDPARLYALRDGKYGVAVDPLLLGRLGLALGDDLRVGTTSFAIRAEVKAEPDRISDGIVLGPRVLMSHEGLAAAGLVQPGSLVSYKYRVKLAGDGGLAAARIRADAAIKAFPDSGWRVTTSDNAASGAGRFVDRLQYFLTLVSTAALITAGAGLANAVAAFVDRRRDSIATMKCLGIANADILGMALMEILLVSLLGIVIGLAAGALAPSLLVAGFGAVLPLPVAEGIEVWPLARAATLGLLITFAFALWPLARIARLPGAAAFRSMVTVENGWPGPVYLAASLVLIAIAAAIMLASFDTVRVTAQYLGGLVVSFVVLGGLAWAVIRLVALLPRPANVLLRHAVLSLNRPGAASIQVVMALGLGLTLFVTLALTDATISRELRASIPEKAPAFFFLDVPNNQLPAFETALKSETGVGAIGNAPMMRGRIVRVKGVPADQVKPAPEAAWALRGDRGVTYSTRLPDGSRLVEGTWWPEDYDGPLLVSMVDEIAKGLGLKIGDTITVNVLGRELEAKVASLREVNWRSLGINFVMVFSPAPLKAAPHAHIVTVEMNGGDEAKLLNDMAETYPSVTAIRVKDALAIVSDLLGKMLTAVRAANALTLLIGVLVLAGALAASLSARTYETVVLKTYGATRQQLLVAFMIEYGLLGLVAAVFGLVMGSLGAWYLAHFILEIPLYFSLPLAAFTAVLAMVLTIGAGLLTTARALSARPSAYLRNE